MRFIGLDLERYGLFTDRSLRFRKGARLHVVYGPNEAGKSTALAAITDLLFGFEHRTHFDFEHAAPDLRVGAEIASRGGDGLAFRRRKGRRDTLIDRCDKALGDDALAPFLGGVTRDVFMRAFGLSTKTLREGAEDMLKADGDVGATLFAAASGLRGPSELRRSLNAEAEAIFAPRASKERRFYQALESFEAARKAMRERELRVGDWKELNEGVAALQAKLGEIDRQRAERSAEHARLQRLKRVAPLASLLDRAVAELDALGSFPDLAPAFADGLRSAIEVEARAAEAEKNRIAELQALVEERDRLVVDEALVGRSAQIAVLFAETGKYAKAKEDLPGVDRNAQALHRALDALARRLGLTAAGEVKERLPADADLALLGGLVEEGRGIDAELASLHAELEGLADERAGLERQRSKAGGVVDDPVLLRERLAAFAPALRRLEQRAALEGAIRKEERALAEAASRLNPPVASLDAVAEAPLPSSEAIARFRRTLELTDREIDRARAEAVAAERSCRETELSLERLAAKRPLPTGERIAAERALRDDEWEKLRPILFGAKTPPETRSAAVAAFERHKAEADRLADDAVADAARVAEHAVQANRLAAERSRRDEAQAALTAIEMRRRSEEETWRALWSPCGLKPDPPAEMGAWLAALMGLLTRRDALRGQGDELRKLDAEACSIAPGMRASAAAAGIVDVEHLTAAQIAIRMEERIGALSADWDRARGLEAKIAASAEHIARLHARDRKLAARSSRWKERWQAALPIIGLTAAATLDEVGAALAAWTEAPVTLERLAEEERRVAGMLRDNAGFEARAAKLISAVAPDLAAMAADAAMKILHERLSVAHAVAARRDDSVKRAALAEARHKSAETALAATRSGLASLAEEARLDGGDTLPALLARLDRRGALEAEAREKREELLRAADGLDEAAIRVELAAFEADAAEQRLSELERDRDRLDRESNESFAALDRELRRKAELEAGVGAELAIQLRRNAEGELTAAAREWAVLKLGALLLGTAIERHREVAQNPLIARAGELFSGLTGGAFAGLGSHFDEDDRPVLVGRRRNGANVRIEGLSEGTRDQLYLALRLAYVESYAARLEPPPFIADDIFVTFDDERTAHGVAALAEIGPKLQCILFTHHRRTVEIAMDRLGEEVDIVEIAP
ncbi:MAG: AAA family ATPase [Hyphomicrobiales bacterium]